LELLKSALSRVIIGENGRQSEDYLEAANGSFTRPKSKPFPPRMNADQPGSEEFDREALLRVFTDRQSKSAF